MKRVIAVSLICLACTSGTAPESVTPASVTVTPEAIRLDGIGDTVTIAAVVKDSLGRTVSGTVTWGSSDPQAIRISNRGTTTAVACGMATITATVANITGTGYAGVYMPPTDPVRDTFAPTFNVDLSRMTRLGDVFYVEDVTAGTGVVIARFRRVTVRWRTWLPDGTVIHDHMGGNSSFDAGSGPTTWLNEGVVGMRIGGKRRVVMGSMLAAGFTYPASRCPSSMVAEIEVIS